MLGFDAVVSSPIFKMAELDIIDSEFAKKAEAFLRELIPRIERFEKSGHPIVCHEATRWLTAMNINQPTPVTPIIVKECTVILFCAGNLVAKVRVYEVPRKNHATSGFGESTAVYGELTVTRFEEVFVHSFVTSKTIPYYKGLLENLAS